jgi:hypothetical protein
MFGYFRDNDWRQITGRAPGGGLADLAPGGVIELAGLGVPFVSMNNEVESVDHRILTERYGLALGRLRDLRGERDSTRR